MAGPCAETRRLLVGGLARVAGPALRQAEDFTRRAGQRTVSTGNSSPRLLRVRAVTCSALFTYCLERKDDSCHQRPLGHRPRHATSPSVDSACGSPSVKATAKLTAP